MRCSTQGVALSLPPQVKRGPLQMCLGRKYCDCSAVQIARETAAVVQTGGQPRGEPR